MSKRVRRFGGAALVAVAATAAGIFASSAPAGLSGVLTLYDNDAIAIPNGNGAARISWADPGGTEADAVTVSFRVRHERTQQLELSIKSPGGDRVSLSKANTKGEDLGVGQCPDEDPDAANFTSFRDAMASSMATGSAPYAGYFVPREPLSELVGTHPAGRWALIVKDTRGGPGGKLLCGLLRIAYAP